MNFFKEQPVRLDIEENLSYMRLQELDYYLSLLSFLTGELFLLILCVIIVGPTWGWL